VPVGRAVPVGRVFTVDNLPAQAAARRRAAVAAGCRGYGRLAIEAVADSVDCIIVSALPGWTSS
jgi:hypothetical protein